MLMNLITDNHIKEIILSDATHKLHGIVPIMGIGTIMRTALAGGTVQHNGHCSIRTTGVGLSDLAYFDNMLIADPVLRRQKHDFMLRVFDTAVLLGVDAVCGFVGRNLDLQMDQNLIMFEEVFVPLLSEAKARGLTYRVEQCPMPGWTTNDSWYNNIAYAPGP